MPCTSELCCRALQRLLGCLPAPPACLRLDLSTCLPAFHPPHPQVGADLTFAGPANQRRGRADSISKIVFQYLARTQPITLEQLQAAAASSAAAASAEAPADKMASGDSSSGLAGGPGSMSVQSEVAPGGGASMAVDAPGSDGIEVDS